MTAITVRRATGTDIDPAAGVIARAFAVLPQAHWLVDDGAQRGQLLHANMTMWVEHALTYGHVDVAGDFEAVAVWFDREHGPVPLPDNYENRLRADCGTWAERFRALDEVFDAYHPSGPHHHLAMLAVEPQHQRRGLGSALLRHHHAELDAVGLCAFLEASTLGNVGLYEAHGYRRVGRPYELAEDGPLMWPMWRDALV
jgi:ribosomal protein S18 acetylase RimI-like enzyme